MRGRGLNKAFKPCTVCISMVSGSCANPTVCLRRCRIARNTMKTTARPQMQPTTAPMRVEDDESFGNADYHARSGARGTNRIRRIPSQSIHQCMHTCCRSSQRCRNTSLSCLRQVCMKRPTVEDCCWCQRCEGAQSRGSTLVEACMGCWINIQTRKDQDRCSWHPAGICMSELTRSEVK